MAKILSSNLKSWNKRDKRDVEKVRIDGKTYRGYGELKSNVTVAVRKRKQSNVWSDDRRILDNGTRYFKEKASAA